MLDPQMAFVEKGVRYYPLSMAAPVAQAPRSTLLHWIKERTSFGGRPLESYYFPPANRYFLSEESIQRAAERFIKWPSEEPAGPITLGKTPDEHGYIAISDAARELGIDHHTIWLWTTHDKKAPTDKLDVIKCPASDQFYISEKDVSQLRKIIPRSGLRRGRRPQATLRPH